MLFLLFQNTALFYMWVSDPSVSNWTQMKHHIWVIHLPKAQYDSRNAHWPLHVSLQRNLCWIEAAASLLTLWLQATGVSCRAEIATVCLMDWQAKLREWRLCWCAYWHLVWKGWGGAGEKPSNILGAFLCFIQLLILLLLAWKNTHTSKYNHFFSLFLLRVLRPPGGDSNFSLGTDDNTTPQRKNKMASSIFAEPDDPHAHRRNNPPSNFLWHASC